MATKPTARKTRKTKAPARKRPKVLQATTESKKTVPSKRLKPAYVPRSCPLCGSKRIDLLKRDTLGKSFGKAALGAIVQVPLRSNIVNPYNLAICKSCGWRDEVML